MNELSANAGSERYEACDAEAQADQVPPQTLRWFVSDQDGGREKAEYHPNTHNKKGGWARAQSPFLSKGEHPYENTGDCAAACPVE